MYATILKSSEASRKAWESRKRGKAAVPPSSGTAAKTAIDPAKLASTVKRIAKLTDDNDHSLAVATAAKMLGMADAQKAAMKIRRDSNTIGHLTTVNAERRKAIYTSVLATAKKKLSAAQYKALHAAF